MFRMEYMCRHPEKYTLEERYAYDKKIVHAVMKSGRIRVVTSGEEKLPKKDGYLIAANHQGKFDALGIFHTHKRPCSFVMDENKAHWPFVSQFLRLVDGLGLKKDDLRQSLTVLRTIGKRIAEGRNYLIFPEGGYDNNGNTLGTFLPGAFKAATYAKAPIVPVALIDSYKPFSVNSLRPVTVQVRYLDPICYEEYKSLKTPEIAALCKSRIETAVAEHLAGRAAAS